MIEIRAKNFKNDYIQIFINKKNIVFKVFIDNNGNEFIISKDILKKELEYQNLKK